MKLNYIKENDYLLPNITIKKHIQKGINKFGYLRLEYLKANKKALYTTLLMEDKLTEHLISVSKISENRFNILMNNYIKNDELLSEKNKETNQIEWVKLMNYYKNIAEEIIINEIINV